MNILKIKDRIFQITEAWISESIDEKGVARWDIFLDTKAEKYDDENWKPDIRGEHMALDVPPLEEIVGKQVYIKDAYNYETDEYLLSRYVFEHEDVFESTIKFLELKENKLKVIWTGKCDIFWDDEYGEGLPFEVEAELSIK